MSIKTLKQQLLSDYNIYNTPTSSKKVSKALIKAFRERVKYIYYCLFIPEYKVIFWMRTASYFRQKKAFFFIYLLAKLMHHHYYNKYGISLPIGQKIGTPFMIGHIPGIIINGNATIGNNVLIMQNVTIGSTRGKGAPRIGNNILLCAGAKIVGNISIGDNVTELLFVAVANVAGTGKCTAVFYLALLAAGLLFIDFDRTPLLFSLDVVPFSTTFFAFGFLFKQQLATPRRSAPIAVMTLVATVTACYWLPVEANIRVCHYSPRYVAWPVCLLVSCALIYIIKNSEIFIRHLQGHKWIGETGRNTLVIYLLHGEILRVLHIGK